MFEFKHLKTINALAETGSVRKAAELLFTSQSALSHQIKDLEHRIDAALFVRNSSPLQMTEQGALLLRLAQQVLPKIQQCQQQLKQQASKKITVTIAMACHGCFQWLLPVIEQFNVESSYFQIELSNEIFDQQEHNEVGLLFTDHKKVNDPTFVYQLLGRFEVVAVMSPSHSLNDKSHLSADDFSDQTLFTYPVAHHQLDVFSLFLTPHNVMPQCTKTVSSSYQMLQMVAANMGIAVVPAWLVTSSTMQSLVTVKKLGQKGVYKSLYARYLQQSECIGAIDQLVPQAKRAFAKLT